jgi:hypothetical protein
MEVRWPSGLVQKFADVPAEELLLVEGKEPTRASAKR